jgi:hypothetical protein
MSSATLKIQHYLKTPNTVDSEKNQKQYKDLLHNDKSTTKIGSPIVGPAWAVVEQFAFPSTMGDAEPHKPDHPPYPLFYYRYEKLPNTLYVFLLYDAAFDLHGRRNKIDFG